VSDATIDVTRRIRIRVLAVRMHRTGIAGVFSVGGAPSIDESTLTADQRAEAAKILEEQTASSVDIKDVETAASVAAIIPRYVKPSCPVCHGEGIARRGGADDICVRVDRRWQADLDHQVFVEGLHTPGRASGARVESTRVVDDAKRLAEAREALARAHAAAQAACTDVDAKIKSLEGECAAYFAAREPLLGHEEIVREARARAGKISVEVREEAAALDKMTRGDGVVSTGVELTVKQVQELRAAAVDRISDAIDRYKVNDAVLARTETKVAALAKLDEENAPLVNEIARLCTERARIARHHQPKIDRAEKRVRRLAYVTGSATAKAAVVSQGDEA